MSGVSLNQFKNDRNLKFKTSNINNIYRGKSTAQTRNISSKNDYQSLGKILQTRRVPPPPILPSLKSENSGNDPNVNLVPTGCQGWGANTKQEIADARAPSSTQSPLSEARTHARADQLLHLAPHQPSTQGGAGAGGGGTLSGYRTWSSVTRGTAAAAGGGAVSVTDHTQPENVPPGGVYSYRPHARPLTGVSAQFASSEFPQLGVSTTTAASSRVTHSTAPHTAFMPAPHLTGNSYTRARTTSHHDVPTLRPEGVWSHQSRASSAVSCAVSTLPSALLQPPQQSQQSRLSTAHHHSISSTVTRHVPYSAAFMAQTMMPSFMQSHHPILQPPPLAQHTTHSDTTIVTMTTGTHTAQPTAVSSGACVSHPPTSSQRPRAGDVLHSGTQEEQTQADTADTVVPCDWVNMKHTVDYDRQYCFSDDGDDDVEAVARGSDGGGGDAGIVGAAVEQQQWGSTHHTAHCTQQSHHSEVTVEHRSPLSHSTTSTTSLCGGEQHRPAAAVCVVSLSAGQQTAGSAAVTHEETAYRKLHDHCDQYDAPISDTSRTVTACTQQSHVERSYSQLQQEVSDAVQRARHKKHALLESLPPADPQSAGIVRERRVSRSTADCELAASRSHVTTDSTSSGVVAEAKTNARQQSFPDQAHKDSTRAASTLDKAATASYDVPVLLKRSSAVAATTEPSHRRVVFISSHSEDKQATDSQQDAAAASSGAPKPVKNVWKEREKAMMESKKMAALETSQVSAGATGLMDHYSKSSTAQCDSGRSGSQVQKSRERRRDYGELCESTNKSGAAHTADTRSCVSSLLAPASKEWQAGGKEEFADADLSAVSTANVRTSKPLSGSSRGSKSRHNNYDSSRDTKHTAGDRQRNIPKLMHSSRGRYCDEYEYDDVGVYTSASSSRRSYKSAGGGGGKYSSSNNYSTSRRGYDYYTYCDEYHTGDWVEGDHYDDTPLDSVEYVRGGSSRRGGTSQHWGGSRRNYGNDCANMNNDCSYFYSSYSSAKRSTAGTQRRNNFGKGASRKTKTTSESGNKESSAKSKDEIPKSVEDNDFETASEGNYRVSTNEEAAKATTSQLRTVSKPNDENTNGQPSLVDAAQSNDTKSRHHDNDVTATLGKDEVHGKTQRSSQTRRTSKAVDASRSRRSNDERKPSHQEPRETRQQQEAGERFVSDNKSNNARRSKEQSGSDGGRRTYDYPSYRTKTGPGDRHRGGVRYSRMSGDYSGDTGCRVNTESGADHLYSTNDYDVPPKDASYKSLSTRSRPQRDRDPKSKKSIAGSRREGVDGVTTTDSSRQADHSAVKVTNTVAETSTPLVSVHSSSSKHPAVHGAVTADTSHAPVCTAAQLPAPSTLTHSAHDTVWAVTRPSRNCTASPVYNSAGVPTKTVIFENTNFRRRQPVSKYAGLLVPSTSAVTQHAVSSVGLSPQLSVTASQSAVTTGTCVSRVCSASGHPATALNCSRHPSAASTPSHIGQRVSSSCADSVLAPAGVAASNMQAPYRASEHTVAVCHSSSLLFSTPTAMDLEAQRISTDLNMMKIASVKDVWQDVVETDHNLYSHTGPARHEVYQRGPATGNKQPHTAAVTANHLSLMMGSHTGTQHNVLSGSPHGAYHSVDRTIDSMMAHLGATAPDGSGVCAMANASSTAPMSNFATSHRLGSMYHSTVMHQPVVDVTPLSRHYVPSGVSGAVTNTALAAMDQAVCATPNLFSVPPPHGPSVEQLLDLSYEQHLQKPPPLPLGQAKPDPSSSVTAATPVLHHHPLVNPFDSCYRPSTHHGLLSSNSTPLISSQQPTGALYNTVVGAGAATAAVSHNFYHADINYAHMPGAATNRCTFTPSPALHVHGLPFQPGAVPHAQQQAPGHLSQQHCQTRCSGWLEPNSSGVFCKPPPPPVVTPTPHHHQQQQQHSSVRTLPPHHQHHHHNQHQQQPHHYTATQPTLQHAPVSNLSPMLRTPATHSASPHVYAASHRVPAPYQPLRHSGPPRATVAAPPLCCVTCRSADSGVSQWTHGPHRRGDYGAPTDVSSAAVQPGGDSVMCQDGDSCVGRVDTSTGCAAAMDTCARDTVADGTSLATAAVSSGDGSHNSCRSPLHVNCAEAAAQNSIILKQTQQPMCIDESMTVGSTAQTTSSSSTAVSAASVACAVTACEKSSHSASHTPLVTTTAAATVCERV